VLIRHNAAAKRSLVATCGILQHSRHILSQDVRLTKRGSQLNIRLLLLLLLLLVLHLLAQAVL
jgi:hypothetical protein